MEILKNSIIPNSNISLILGFFDGIHNGHKNVIMSAVNYAKNNNSKTALITFSKSPAEYFGIETKYILSREDSYAKIEELGVDYLLEEDFNTLAKIPAEEYLKILVKNYSPISISTGFNYTFGNNRCGNPDLLIQSQDEYGYKYLMTNPYKENGEIISSTKIKHLLQIGDIQKANQYLGSPFCISSKVIKGLQIARKLGFPTANMIYPENIVRIPYGVYIANAFGHKAVLNWGIKPTINGKEELLELHILDFNENLYNKELKFNILSKIRDEIKFNSLEELKQQIIKDVETCSKL